MNFNLNQRVDQALAKSKDRDPQTIARKLMARLTAEERDAALASCLADRVRIQITRARLSDHPTCDAYTASVAGSRTQGPSKWRIQSRVYVPEVGWRFEFELTVPDLRAVAGEYSVRALQMTAKQIEYAKRAQQLEQSGFATWGEYVASQEQAA